MVKYGTMFDGKKQINRFSIIVTLKPKSNVITITKKKLICIGTARQARVYNTALVIMPYYYIHEISTPTFIMMFILYKIIS